jgi:hypothetical protein
VSVGGCRNGGADIAVGTGSTGEGVGERAVSSSYRARAPQDGATPRRARFVGVSSIAKGIVWSAGFGAALLTIYGWFQLLGSVVDPYQAEYERVDRLSVGVSSAYFDDVLGTPALSDTASWHGQELSRNVYLLTGYLVASVVDDGGDVVRFTVLSCDRRFQPTFVTAGDEVLRLNSQPLGAMQRTAEVTVYSWTLLTGSSPQAQLLDVSRGPSLSYERSSVLGVSEICVGEVAALPDEVGPPAERSEAVRAFRAAHPPNFYVESTGEIADLDLVSLVPDTRGIPAKYVSRFVDGR